MLIRLTYASQIAADRDRSDIEAIVEQSRPANQRRGITGVLAFHDGRIMQILEGPEREVLALYERIRMDDRHHGVVELQRETIDVVQFERWGMTSRPLADVLLMVDGY
ncbi:BLUF domain-containing protein [Aurantimonas sp. Leaf443]|uniref:BLUF domain-containing protein n=1 Tax=Aurantimonas sp. Leaf443 TaxID=1736378 RepID=UPI0006F71B22|nr:BLUF domain-containing protein [Aurantimonas sp. Leaf443]KQT86314.1 hypothetical protein ASG48_07100 [Aurantimonas sp. Leaf443]